MRRHPRSFLLRILILAAVLALPGAAFAQRGERSLLDQLEQEDVQTELKLSAEQLQQLGQLRETMNDRSGFAELMRKSAQVESEEERASLREQMTNYAATRRQQAEEKLNEVLSAEQLTRLGQLSFQRRGMRALGDDDVAGTLGLTDAQKQQIARLSHERNAARQEATDLDTDEARQQFQAVWDAKYAVVLTAEQRQQWASMSGPPMGSGPAAIAAVGSAARVAGDLPVESVRPGDEVIASFGTTAPDEHEEPRDPNKLYFNFLHAPWSEVLPLFAKAAGLTLDLHTTPPGTFSHIDDKGYTVTEALDIINGYLLARGYILVRRDGGFLVPINVEDPIPPNLVPTVSASELPDRGRNELLTVVFRLTIEEDVDAVATEVEKLTGPQGKVVGIKPTRSIVVTDIGANLIRIDELLPDDIQIPPDDLIFKEYTLSHILAEDAEFIVRTLLGLSNDAAAASTTAASSNSRESEEERRQRERASRFSRFGGGSGFPFGGGRTPTPAPTTAGSSNRSASKANTIADPRTNKLLVSATAAEHRNIEEALKSIDVAELSPMASDRPYGAMGGKQMTVIQLANYDPTAAAVMLQSLFSQEDDDAPVITADLVRRQLIVRASEAQLYQIKQLLLDLGEDGTGTRSAANRGPVRTYSLSGRDPSELLPILERMWAAQRGSNLRVITPGEDGATRRQSEILRDLRERNENRPARGDRPQRPADVEQAPGSSDDGSVRNGKSVFEDDFAVGTEIDGSIETSEVQAPAESAQVGGVTIRVMGDELLLISQDEAALDELEEMLENVMQAIPPRTTWSIFPLKSADATEAAAMLEQLFPDSRVSSASTSSGGTLGAITGSIRSFGSGVADLTGLSDLGSGPQTLRIIPETRLNALWVAGPAYKVQEVEEMLSIIDSSGLTDSLRDRVPRLIPVKYADIDDVYEIVSSVYAPEMQAIGGAGGDPRQAFAAMFGGRRGGDDENGRNQEQREPQVTLGVDTDTSHLIVSADDQTFLEIEDLVFSIDQASQDARRTVAVRPLLNTNASMIQDSLQSIIPKVTVSTSSSRGRPSTSSSSGSPSGGSSGGDDAEAAQRRAEFIRRMQESGGGFGRGGFGGGGPGGGAPGGFRGGRGFGGGGDGGDRGGDRGGRGR